MFLWSYVVQMLGCGVGPCRSLHASAQCREYNEDLILRLEFIFVKFVILIAEYNSHWFCSFIFLLPANLWGSSFAKKLPLVETIMKVCRTLIYAGLVSGILNGNPLIVE